MKRTKTLWKGYKFQGWGREKLDESGIFVSESKNDDETPRDIENVFKGKKKKSKGCKTQIKPGTM